MGAGWQVTTITFIWVDFVITLYHPKGFLQRMVVKERKTAPGGVTGSTMARANIRWLVSEKLAIIAGRVFTVIECGPDLTEEEL